MSIPGGYSAQGSIPISRPGGDGLLARHLQPFTQIVEALGIRGEDIVGLSTKAMKPLDAQKAADLGLPGKEMVAELYASEELAKINKNFEKIREETLDKETLLKMARLLGMEEDEDALVFADENGGLYIVHDGVKAIKP